MPGNWMTHGRRGGYPRVRRYMDLQHRRRGYSMALTTQVRCRTAEGLALDDAGVYRFVIHCDGEESRGTARCMRESPEDK